MRKLIAAFSIALLGGIGVAQACPTPTEKYVLYSPDFAFYPESLINAYKEAKKENEELKAKLEVCQKELALLKAKESELKARYGELSQEVQRLREQIAEIEALQKRLEELKAQAEGRLSKCEEMLKRWESLPRSSPVRKGDPLWDISEKDTSTETRGSGHSSTRPTETRLRTLTSFTPNKFSKYRGTLTVKT